MEEEEEVKSLPAMAVMLVGVCDCVSVCMCVRGLVLSGQLEGKGCSSVWLCVRVGVGGCVLISGSDVAILQYVKRM